MSSPGRSSIHKADRRNETGKAAIPGRQVRRGLSERVRKLLASAGLTLHSASLESERLYGVDSPFRIPHTLYHFLDTSPVFRPNLHQVAALSRISGYSFEDWLMALDLDLERLAAASSLLAAKRTRIIDPSLEIFEYVLPGLGEREKSTSAVLPFAELLQGRNAVRARVDPDRPRPSVFARLGSDDAFAYPELQPGSIVRVNLGTSVHRDRTAAQPRPPLLFIENAQGYWCGRFDVSENGVVRVAASELAYAQALLATPAEARIIGTVDMEFRWPCRPVCPSVPQELAAFRQPQAIEIKRSLRDLLRHARTNAGLTLAEASGLSRRIAGFLHDEQYSISQSTLADFEARDTPPRHLPKVMAVCLAYGIAMSDFLAAAGIPQCSLGHKSVPGSLIDDWAGRRPRITEQEGARIADTGLSDRIPCFLRDCLPELSTIARPSLRDFFWVSGNQTFLPRYMTGSRAVLVNRRIKKPVRDRDLPGWQQPAYVLWHRRGSFLCACCSREDDALALYPESGTGTPERIRRDDIDIIGQIVGVARYID